MRDRNRCNHNDFQNIGVNGARMTSSMGLVEALARKQTDDHPMLVFLSLLGNDVCNGHPGYDHMSDPDVYYDSAIESLTALDAILPPNSYIVAPGLFDGELLYDTMGMLQHPLGCTYDGMYGFMNCLEENPCWGWLNGDAEVRANTTAHARSLDVKLAEIEANQNFQNFKFIYFEPNWRGWFDEYKANGGDCTDLIEPVDGFHPSQTGNAMFGQKFWQFLVENHPEAIGPVNPHNDEIDEQFFNRKHSNVFNKGGRKLDVRLPDIPKPHGPNE
jgi:acyloxyacyl hydrolase